VLEKQAEIQKQRNSEDINERPTKVLLAGLETIGCSSLSAAVPADGILLGFLLLCLVFSFSIGFSSGA